jgi:predicted PurR-regulated permease PerM
VTEFADSLTAAVTTVIEHIQNEPRIVAGVILLAALLYYALQRKNRVEREADKRLDQLTRDKAGQYDHLRPPH